MKNVINAGICTLVLASVADAHPGHGSTVIAPDQHSLWHYLTEPMHLGLVISVVVTVLVASRVTKFGKVSARG